MTSATNAPVDLYIATYPDPDAARGDWDTIKQLAKDDVIKVDGLVLVSRRADGKIQVDDDFHETAKGAVWGAVGAGIGAGAGTLVSHAQKEEIKADVDDTLPPNSSGIVAMFEETWEDDIDKALSSASNVTKEKIDADSADQVKAAASKK